MIWKRKSSGRGGSCSGRDEMRERLISAVGGGGCAAGCVPPGCVAVLVGGGDEPERVVVDVRALAQPSVRALLEVAQREFGFDQKGVLRIPCAADEFRRAVAAGGHRCRR
ncbi:auxin-responsive protein SAUR32-like [Miscanthus floridulus]|uniref:auxin-responsive protein SAUR32-like n=1 Tax=Miscanthus floridulus TaxID=154761 RepID=UPI00345A2AF2